MTQCVFDGGRGKKETEKVHCGVRADLDLMDI